MDKNKADVACTIQIKESVNEIKRSLAIQGVYNSILATIGTASLIAMVGLAFKIIFYGV